MSNMDRIEGFLQWTEVASWSTEMFPAVCSLTAGYVLINVEEHLNALQKKFSVYFEKSVQVFNWVHGPYISFYEISRTTTSEVSQNP
jgi:hypothetical protein